MNPRTIANAIFTARLIPGDTVVLGDGREFLYVKRWHKPRSWVVLQNPGDEWVTVVHARDILRAGWAHQGRRDGEDRRIR